MPLTSYPEKAQFRISGLDMSPRGLQGFPADEQKIYWRQIALYARDEKYRELRKGIGVDGRKLPPRKHPRSDRATGVVLVPHWSDSRFITELRWEGTPTGAVLWWKSPWGRIVRYHALGEVRGAPVRNTVGLTSAGLDRVKRKAEKWWAGHVAAGRIGEQGYTKPLRVELGSQHVPEGGGVLVSTEFRRAPVLAVPPSTVPPGPYRPIPREPTGPVRRGWWQGARELAAELSRASRGLVGAQERTRVAERLAARSEEEQRQILERFGIKEPEPGRRGLFTAIRDLIRTRKQP